MKTKQISANNIKLQIQPYFNSAKASPTLVINERSKSLMEQGRNVYRFGFGQSPFPVPGLVQECLKANTHRKAYLPVKGLPELRQAVSKFNNARGIDSSAEDVLIGPGSKILMFLLQSVLSGELLLPAPSWVSYEPQGLMVGKTVTWLPTSVTNDWMLDPETLDEYCKKRPGSQKLLVLNYPSNPVGASYTESQLQAITEVARKHKIIVLSDEIYGELYFDQPHQSLAQIYPEGTIVSSGLSKWCGAGGWRLGTFTFPANMRALLKIVSVAASETFSAVAAPIQYAAVKAYLPHPSIDSYLQKSRAVLKTVAEQVSAKLSEALILHPKPQGGFYLLPDFENYRDSLQSKGIMNNEQLCHQLLEDTGVALLPGSTFGILAQRLQARLAFVDFDGDLALNLANPDLNSKDLNKITGHMIEGLDKIIEWLSFDQA